MTRDEGARLLSNKPEHHRLWSEAMPSPVGDDGRYHHPLYFACNDFVDDQIGRVINTLTPVQRTTPGSFTPPIMAR